MGYEAGKFSQEANDENDDLGKRILIDYLKSIGHKIISKEENYNHDI